MTGLPIGPADHGAAISMKPVLFKIARQFEQAVCLKNKKAPVVIEAQWPRGAEESIIGRDCIQKINQGRCA